ncbi:hypothetical protein Poly51_13660 [Rubripirellula tenax]|uniref:Uncharacterized protein n=1 Tax=Rubripirellula tenax TaxID=2528015 RepID=A0A5C6FD58_9BACT|nr:hypothetical protein [Rubripirellula tenax]TWU58587.1 hypothetical protein Poly51_13660 [Rubripirellula tenax]
MSLPLWTWIPLGFFIFAILLDIATLVISFREKRTIWPFEPFTDSNNADAASKPLDGSSRATVASAYQPAASLADAFPITPFAMQYGSQLNQMGYQYVGAFRHVKGGIYQIRYDVMVSADRLILAFVAAGTLAKIPVANVTLVSLGTRPSSFAPGQRSDLMCGNVSMIAEAAFEHDFTGRTISMVFPNASANELQSLHAQRWGTLQPQPFGPEPLGEYHRYCLDVAEDAERRGSLYRVDDMPNYQRPHPGSAILMFVAMKKFMWGRRIWPHRWRVKRLPPAPFGA